MIGAGLVTVPAISFNCRQKKAGRLSVQQIFRRTSVDLFQWLDLRQSDLPINLVNAGVRWAELDNLRIDIRDEATIRNATGDR